MISEVIVSNIAYQGKVGRSTDGGLSDGGTRRCRVTPLTLLPGPARSSLLSGRELPREAP